MSGIKSLSDNIQLKLVQLKHYRDHGCQLDHARTIAEGRILQLEQVATWVAELPQSEVQIDALRRMAGHDPRDPGLSWDDNLLLIQSAAQAAKDILAGLSLPVAQASWMPIETAPKNRKRILLYQAGRGAFEGWWHTAWPHPEEYWMDDADSEPNPTHWRPTLAPPSAQSGGAAK